MARTGHGDRLASAAEKAADSKGFERAARVGYVASGVLHLLIGVIALQIASGSGGGSADSSGAVAALAAQPGGLVLLWICFLGCLALALFQASRVWLDGRGLQGKDAWKARGSAAAQAVTYGAIGVSFGTFALGGAKDSGESTAGWSATLMAQPAGAVLLGLVGLGIVVVGGYFIFKGATGRFRKDLKPVPAGAWDRAVTVTGTLGFVAKGVSLAILGILVMTAAFTADPEKSTGLDGALHALRGQPFGWLALGAVGAGLICYGLYTGILRARFAKL
ncbi:DUF1206 domain-containing protein [Arthrobacter sp. APC 3897]|uniref:DUF1206 domain-containing protein n=1 Tax=Arthrobacter sp. APC 3897 TaxID=3035204 RepID=UPI0025B3B6C3|nr:DUF1206 domain-containing protein [Arthrobacter sp. APC 3897]MDN3481287.1 DUF1206 domain-containing protein [Arthrobacter sp. APC 3897]